jgi:predicted kinase
MQGQDDSQIPSLAMVREAIQQRLSDGHLTVWDSWLPLRRNLQLAHYLGMSVTARQGWRIED